MLTEKRTGKWIANLACAGLAFQVLSMSCSTTGNTRKMAVDQSGYDSTSFTLREDSILPPLKITVDEIIDYPPGELAPLVKGINLKDKKYLHFIDEKMVEDKDKDKAFKRLDKAEISYFKFLPAEEAMELYGQKAANGVVIIETKKKTKGR